MWALERLRLRDCTSNRKVGGQCVWILCLASEALPRQPRGDILELASKALLMKNPFLNMCVLGLKSHSPLLGVRRRFLLFAARTGTACSSCTGPAAPASIGARRGATAGAAAGGG